MGMEFLLAGVVVPGWLGPTVAGTLRVRVPVYTAVPAGRTRSGPSAVKIPSSR